jgi:hypothetical protein
MTRNCRCAFEEGTANIALLYLASAIIAWLVIEAWFDPLQFTVFAGADSRTFDVEQKGSSMPSSECALGNTPLLSCYFLSRTVDVPR